MASVKPTLNQENVNNVPRCGAEGVGPDKRSEPECLLSCTQKSEEDYVWGVFHMPMNLTLTKPSGFLLALITMLNCGFGATPAFAQADAAHEKCLKATDYKGCIESQGLSIKDEQLITGILWDTAEWKSDGVIRIKVNRMRGGGLWVGNSMRLSVMEVDCNTAEFDVESDGYRKQSIQSDASRQAPVIYSKLCNKKGK
jgi:hypothetical protein